jgi:hypothetical protein
LLVAVVIVEPLLPNRVLLALRSGQSTVI